MTRITAFVICLLPGATSGFVGLLAVKTSISDRRTFILARNPRKDQDDDITEHRPSNRVDPSKLAALDGVMNQIERSYGRGSIVKLGDADHMVVDCIGTGALTLGQCVIVTWHREKWIIQFWTTPFIDEYYIIGVS